MKTWGAIKHYAQIPVRFILKPFVFVALCWNQESMRMANRSRKELHAFKPEVWFK